ncbi:UNVERIFIED_CONTAM: hypothetical protein FKN15_048203 [Acipenser sinensis]
MTDRGIYEAAAPFLQYHACARQSAQISPVTQMANTNRELSLRASTKPGLHCVTIAVLHHTCTKNTPCLEK